MSKKLVLTCVLLILFSIFQSRAETLKDLEMSKSEYKLALMDFSKKLHVSSETIFKLLRGGMSSSSIYKYNLENKSFAIRLLSYEASIENRLSELNMHKFLAEQGLAPNILYVDNEKDPHIIVMKYIDGRVFNPKFDLVNDNIMKQIVDGLNQIHCSCNIELYNDTMIDSIKGFVKNLKTEKTVVPSKFFKWYEQLIQEYEEYKSKNVPIHGDFAPGNIIISKEGRVYFIDFQEARNDSVFAEFGYFFYESGIDNIETIKSVLAKYFNREVKNFELNAVLFYMKATAFLSGMFRLSWIDKNYTVENLDEILENLKENGIDYFKKGDYDKIGLKKLDAQKRANYVLSFFKDYENMKVE